MPILVSSGSYLESAWCEWYAHSPHIVWEPPLLLAWHGTAGLLLSSSNIPPVFLVTVTL